MPAETSPHARRVLVTGATGGIGRAIVDALAATGCQVAACDVAGAPLAELASATTTVEFDVRDQKAVRFGVTDAITALAGCDALIANAGIVDTIHRAERFSEDESRRDLETNLYGAFYVAQAAFEALAQSEDARIVLISSVAVELGIPGQVAYGASKAGLVGMARSLAAEWAPRGIRCNVVMPGLIATPKVLAMPEPLRDGLTQSIPLHRFGSTEELAGVITFLLSPAAAYITGAVIRVDGGYGLSLSALRS